MLAAEFWITTLSVLTGTVPVDQFCFSDQKAGPVAAVVVVCVKVSLSDGLPSASVVASESVNGTPGVPVERERAV